MPMENENSTMKLDYIEFPIGITKAKAVVAFVLATLIALEQRLQSQFLSTAKSVVSVVN